MPKVLAFRRIWRSNRLTSKVPSLRAKVLQVDEVQIFCKGHKKFGPSSTYNFTQPCNVKKRVEDGPNFCDLLRISELSCPCDLAKYFFVNQSINFGVFWGRINKNKTSERVWSYCLAISCRMNLQHAIWKKS